VGLRPHLFLLLLLAACASAPSVQPRVVVAQTSRVQPLRTLTETAVPVEFRLDIENPLDHQITLLVVEMETVGETGGYFMPRVRHTFSKAIDAHKTESIDVRTWVRPLQETDAGNIVTAVMIRGMARFDSNGTTVQSAFTARLAQ